jgi:hypothetical protein
MQKTKLFMPILSRQPSPDKLTRSLSFTQWLTLITEEEDYYEGDQQRTMLMFTRLRKVYYDSWGWSTQVIRGAKDIEGRYQTEMVRVENPVAKDQPKNFYRTKQCAIPALAYQVTYKPTDKKYPERAGLVPDIYADNNQEIITPQGFICDIGHVFSGIDAWNYFAPVSPLPNWLIWLSFLFPRVSSNFDFATWLGDIASVTGDFLMEQLQNKKIKREEEQDEIEEGAPPADMLGDIDPYAIIHFFDTQCKQGAKVTDIFKEFYDPSNYDHYQVSKFTIFCKHVGLTNFKNGYFDNERKWYKTYIRELRAATIFYVYGEMGGLKGVWTALKIWLRLYEKELDLKYLLEIFVNELKKEISKP